MLKVLKDTFSGHLLLVICHLPYEYMSSEIVVFNHIMKSLD
jgi:hypothetical protein